MAIRTLAIPDVLAPESGSYSPEALFHLLPQLAKGEPLRFDMSQVRFVYPPGIVGLALFLRAAWERSGSQIILFGFQERILAYFQRMDFLEICQPWAHCTDRVSAAATLSRKQDSPNLLELRIIRDHDQVNEAANRARDILKTWLAFDSEQLSDLVTILSEMGGNVCDHSRDFGFISIQKYLYASERKVAVRIAVGDLGIGIRKSLMRRHGNLGPTSLAYIRAALEGKTSRRKGVLGNGFQLVQSIVGRCQGSLFVRSEDAAVLVDTQGGHAVDFPNLLSFPGTFVSIFLYQPVYTSI
ncbi:MAG: hypothetical protein M1132_10845 [Chloroflexi bacterium]|nr:hypothetical protein [Chloroflexota bacterium]